MHSYETSATVDQQGQIHVSGVPFAVGTEVEITIKPIQNGVVDTAAASERAARLFEALDKARNIEPIGPLRREEIYDRKVLR